MSKERRAINRTAHDEQALHARLLGGGENLGIVLADERGDVGIGPTGVVGPPGS